MKASTLRATGLALCMGHFLVGCSEDRAEVTTTTTASAPAGDSQAEAVELLMHYSPHEYDARPRVKVSFLSHEYSLGYSLLFDTASDRTYILRASGSQDEVAAIADGPPSYLPQDDAAQEPVRHAAKWMEGYHDAGRTKRIEGARILEYGNEDMPREIHIHSTVKEGAMLYSGSQRFLFPVDLDLASKIETGYVGIGLMGAGRTSALAESAGVFAYLGPQVNYSGRTMTFAGKLFVGEMDSFDSFCAHGGHIVYFPTQPRVSKIHWVVQGSVTAGGPDSATPFIIDTGSSKSFVTLDVLDHVREKMIAGGAQLVKAQTPSNWEEYANCPAPHLLPIVTFNLGEGPSSVNVSLLPEEYILTLLSGNCLLQIADSELDGARIVGMNVLSKMMTVFDRPNDRLGFCITRS